MIIIIKNKDTLILDDFELKCCIGKNGFSQNKIEGDKKTPIGNYGLGPLYYRKDRKTKPKITKYDFKQIQKNIFSNKCFFHEIEF